MDFVCQFDWIGDCLGLFGIRVYDGAGPWFLQRLRAWDASPRKQGGQNRQPHPRRHCGLAWLIGRFDNSVDRGADSTRTKVKKNSHANQLPNMRVAGRRESSASSTKYNLTCIW